MQTTSRCEGENHFFGKLTNDDLHLIELLQHFDVAMDIHINAQYKNDHELRFKLPNLVMGILMEKEASGIFTRYTFFESQREMVKSMLNCGFESIIETDGNMIYSIQDVEDDVKFRGRVEVLCCF